MCANKESPPSPAYVSQCGHGSVSDVLVPEIRNESEDLGWDLVDWREHVSPAPDEAEDFRSVLLKSVDPRGGTHKRPLACLFVRWPNLSLGDTANVNLVI